MATPMFAHRQADTCVEPYLFHPIKEGNPQPIQSITAKRSNCIQLTFTDGTTNTITWSVADGKMRTLTVDPNSRQLDILY